MMISSAGASPFAAAAALDSALRPSAVASDDGGGDSTPQSGPDVVVTLGQGGSSPVTYDASGRFGGASPAQVDDAQDGAAGDGSAPSTDATADPDRAVAA